MVAPKWFLLLLHLELMMLSKCRGHEPLEKVFAQVSLLLARHHTAECLQILKGENESRESRERIRKMMKELTSADSKTTTGIYTFEQYIKRKTGRSLKVSCYKPMKIMFDDEETKIGFSKLSHSIPVRGSVWVLYIDSSLQDFFRSAYLPFDIEFIVADTKSPNLIIFYEVYRVREDYPLKVKYYGNWSLSGGLDAADEMIYNRRNDLEGALVKTGSIENWPTSTYKGPTGWDGYFPRVWKELTNLLNCTTANFESVDGNTGSENENGTWNGLVGMALRGDIDIIVSELTIDRTRTRVLDHFHPLITTSYQIFFRGQGNNLEWASVFKPFSKGIWIGVVVWLLSGAVVMAFCYYFSLFYGFEDDRENVFGITKTFFFMLQTICQQGHHVVPRSMACRILFFTSYIASAILIPFYSASLISSLTQQTPYRPFNTLSQMLQDGTYRILVRKNTAEHAYFSNAKNPLMETIYEKLIKTTPKKYEMVDTKHALQTVCKVPRFALFGIEAILSLRFATTVKPECSLVTLPIPLSTVYLTMGAPSNHPYSGLINHYLHKLIDSGVTKRIERMTLPVIRETSEKAYAQVQSEEVFQVFVMTAFFIGFSLVLLLVEKIVFEWKKNSKKVRSRTPGKRNWYYRIEIFV